MPVDALDDELMPVAELLTDAVERLPLELTTLAPPAPEAAAALVIVPSSHADQSTAPGSATMDSSETKRRAAAPSLARRAAPGGLARVRADRGTSPMDASVSPQAGREGDRRN